MASIRRRGPSHWQARISRKGFPTQAKTFSTRAQADAWASVVEGRMVLGEFVDRTEAQGTTLGDTLARYAREVTPGKKGARQERRRINAWIRRTEYAQRPLGSIRGADLAAYRDARLAEGVGGNTIRLDLAVISHLCEIARKEWGMEGLANPVKTIRRPKLPKERARKLQEGEEAALLGVCPAPLAPVVRLAIETGMRRSELLRLDWKDIDLAARVAHLKDTKNGSPRDVPLSSVAASLLRSIPRNIDGRVFGIGGMDQQGFRAGCAGCRLS